MRCGRQRARRGPSGATRRRGWDRGLLVLAAACILACMMGTPSVPSARAGAGSPSRSVGWPWRGHLVAGVAIGESEHVRHVDADVPRAYFYGTAEMGGLIARAAEHVATAAPADGLPVRLNLGEVSRRGGGNITGHRSHENGRDVDIGFYLRDEDGRPVEPRRFVRVYGSGRGRLDDTVLHFDDERNWRLVEALVTDPGGHVPFIFVGNRVRRRLLRTARRLDVPDATYERARAALFPPVRSRHPHQNHFHVRIYCAPDDLAGCRDRGPIWPWSAEGREALAERPEAYLAVERPIFREMLGGR